MPRPRRTLTGRRERQRRRETQALRRYTRQNLQHQLVDPPQELQTLQQQLPPQPPYPWPQQLIQDARFYTAIIHRGRARNPNETEQQHTERLALREQRLQQRGRTGTIEQQGLQLAASHIVQATRIPAETEEQYIQRLTTIAIRAIETYPQMHHVQENRLYAQQLLTQLQPMQNQVANIPHEQPIHPENQQQQINRLQANATRMAEGRAQEQPVERDRRLTAQARPQHLATQAETNEQSVARIAQIAPLNRERQQHQTAEQRQNRLRPRANRGQQQLQEEHPQRRAADAENIAQRRIPPQLQPQQANQQQRQLQMNLPQQHSLGPMSSKCPHCNDKFFPQEKTVSRGQYIKCCRQGKIRLPPIAAPSENIKQLFSGDSPDSAHFKTHIRTYNSALGMASWNAPIVQHPTGGPRVVTIHGQAYHLTSPPEPVPGEPPKFAQLYILNTRQAIQERLHLPENAQHRPHVLQQLQDELMTVNPYAHDFRYMGEIMQEQRELAAAGGEQPQPVRMIIPDKRDRDRRYDQPSATEIAAVYIGEEGEPPNPSERDIAIYPRQDRRTIKISAISPHTDPMTYPILFFHGESGWQPGLLQTDAGGHPDPHVRLTLRQYYAFRIAFRDAFSTIHLSGQLYHQYLVDAVTKIEGNMLHWIRTHQDHLRTECYQGLMDHIRREADQNDLGVGRVVILPSTFTGSPRNMHQNYQDAMSIVRKKGKPDLFITVTVNPKSPDITNHLLPHQTAVDRPDLVCRVFQLKIKAIKDDLLKEDLFGRAVGYVNTIEFQKRGLPHMHLLLFLADHDKPRTPADVDRLVSAEIPNPDQQPELYQKVKNHMIHGPCGELNPNSPCMENNQCQKGYPKPLHVRDTQFNVDGYPLYRRRGQFTAHVRGHEVNDSFVVPYNPILLQKYDCHINVEVCTTIKSVKYIFKYIHKGYEHAHLEIREGQLYHDEILEFLNARYVGPHEAVFRILEYKLHDMSHAIQRLAIHLPLQQMVYFHEGQEERALQVNQGTTLTAWFELNQRDPDARQYLYHDIPDHYTYDPRAKKWKARQRATNTIGRIYQVQPSTPERFCLRMMLLHCPGATSFEALRTLNGHEYPSFKDAARAMGLLEDDNELHHCLEEANLLQMPSQMRSLFATLLLFNCPSDPRQLFVDFQEAMSEDLLHTERRRLNDNTIQFADRHIHLCLYYIDIELQSHGKSIKDEEFDLPQIPDNFHPPDHEAPQINAEEEQRLGQEMLDQLNPDQRHVADSFLHALNTQADNRCFFVDGSGGTGKTFLYNTLVHILRGMEIKVKCVAYSGIAATLLIDGATAHSTFQIPIPLHEHSTCNVSRQTYRARDLASTTVFIWDEASMVPGLALKAVDRLLRDITRVDAPFGGKFMFLGGDFRQVLPVIPKASREHIVNSSLKNSLLWRHFQQFHLVTNMRATRDVHYRAFAEWLLRIGDGREPSNENDQITLPPEVHLPSNTLQEMVDATFPQGPNGDPQYMAKRCCLTPKNINSHVINDLVLQKLPGNKKTYLSIDKVVTDDAHEAAVYTMEFLNSMTPSGMPLHKLELKASCDLTNYFISDSHYPTISIIHL